MFELALLVIFTILIFAIIGLYASLVWIFDSTPRKQPDRKTTADDTKPSLNSDVLAAKRLVKYLRATEQIEFSEYSRLRSLLSQPFRRNYELESIANSKAKAPTQNPEAQLITDEPIVEAKIATSSVAPNKPALVASNALPLASANVENRSESQSVKANAKPAPWDLPDPPVAPPRRTFGELMSGFMEEKNMRWGELASGILIVLSAVGLVVSLREQLRNTIPYFSSLLFLLMTAAIHGAGIYTLRKWNLRNTSRGALVIGLLLIPLNFVAACVLAGGAGDELRRPISDPWLWLAVMVGVSGFSVLAWYSSKHLFRAGHLPIVIALMGCGIGTLLLGRLIETTSSSVWYFAYSLPVAASFLVGTCMFDTQQWQRTRWSERAGNRLYLFLGISTFAALAALSMVTIRAESTLFAVVSIAPIISVICIVTSWLGSILKNNSRDDVAQRVTGLTLEILGLILIGISLVTSLSNPITFLINCMISGIGLLAMFVHQRNESRIGIAWAILSMGMLAGLNFIAGKFSVDHWTSLEEIKTAVLNGKSGLCLLASGAAVVGCHAVVRKRIPDPQRQKSFMLTGWFTGASLLLAGCLIALIASLTNRDNVFDVMTATSLLGLAAVGAVVAAMVSQKRSLNSYGLGHIAGVLLLAALAHGLLWNPTIANFVAKFNCGNAAVAWVCVVVIHGLVMGMVAAWLARKKMNSTAQSHSDNASLADEFGYWSIATALVGSIGLLGLMPTQSGWATAFAIISSLSWYCIGWSIHQKSTDEKSAVASPFVLSTGFVVCVGIAELATRFTWFPEIASPEHWLAQAVGIASWASVWTIAMMYLNRAGDGVKPSQFSWLNQNKIRIELGVMFGSTAVVTGLIVANLFFGSTQELFKESKLLASVFSLETFWVYAALATAAIGFLISTIEKPTVFKGGALIAIWLLAWSTSASVFVDSKSIASGIRWLLPIGGAIGAGLLESRRRFLPAWSASRRMLKLSGPSRWRKKSTQTLINLALAVIAGVVILISTITVSQVLLNGVEALGGPTADSWFKRIPAEISFGMPVAIVVGTFLLLAISERRSLLATLGSTVFQYVVLLAVVLLFYSPHPKLASSWFINILQAVSLGMTAYGFVWWWMRHRIERQHQKQETKFGSINQLETHTLINGFLITSLAALVMGRFFVYPDHPGDWISSVGSPLGIFAWASVTALGFVVWRERSESDNKLAVKNGVLNRLNLSPFAINCLVGSMGLVLVALLAAVVDQTMFAPWLSFKAIAIGAIVVAAIQWSLLKLSSSIGGTDDSQFVHPLSNAWPATIVFLVGLAFAMRGALLAPESYWLYFALIGVWAVLVMGIGWLHLSARFGFVSAAVAVAATTTLVIRDPQSWFTQSQPYWFNLATIAIGAIGIMWTAFYLFQRKSNRVPIKRSFLSMPNVAMLLGVVWIFVAALAQLPLDAGLLGGRASSLANPLGGLAFATMAIFAIVMAWNDRARFRLICRCLLSMAAMLVVVSGMVSRFESTPEFQFIAVTFGASLVVLTWGAGWFHREKFRLVGRRLGQTRMVAFERSVGRQLPIFSMIAGVLILACALLSIFTTEVRVLRYLSAAVPFALALSFAFQSNPNSRRWLQVFAFALATVGFLFLGWADLTPKEMSDPPVVQLLVRTLIVLAGLMFVYGGLVSRWVVSGDTWLKSLREMSVATCALAIVCFALVLVNEVIAFDPVGGCGLSVAESIAVAVLVGGMIVGLITIAIRPENDPFALSLRGRMGYVYAGEVVAAALAAHVYLSMPWLFKFGILEYWPYIMMAICFVGVGVAQILEKRNLTVLGEPLFQTAAIIPMVVAGAIFAIHSQADAAMVMLTVGMAYLMIGYVRQSMLSGAGAIVFGTLALWIFLESRLSFFENPQLWLIPPAVSVLIAGQLFRKSLNAQQLAALRYTCVMVIYVSSTSEIFISGIGEKLWPPIVLAVLAVLGIMSGIMFQVKSYLYFGSLFLLIAMITMVAHAHQRLDHVWPWWAFGIGLGIAILVMFGLFEKRKNEMNVIARRLKKWEV